MTLTQERPTECLPIATPVSDETPYLRLAEAIEKGSRTGPQCFGVMYRDDASCALGALADGLLGYRTRWSILAVIRDRIGLDLTEMYVQLPPEAFEAPPSWFHSWLSVAKGKPLRLHEAIMALNDGLGWSRERIANWLRSLQTAP